MKQVVITNQNGCYVVVDEMNWEAIDAVQKGIDHFKRKFYQFNGEIPGVIDEDGSVPYIRCIAVFQNLSAPVTDTWSLTKLKASKVITSA